MKSTLKIAYASQGNLGKPVIKIVQPIEVIDPSEYDEHVGSDDDRDRMIRDFLQSPQNVDLNDWFEVNTRFPIPLQLTSNQKPTHYITTISPVLDDRLFYRFKHSILNRIVPFEDLVTINRNKDQEITIESPNGTRKTERIDLSVEKHKKITEFFDWLEQTEYCSWDEQQPTDPDGRPRN